MGVTRTVKEKTKATLGLLAVDRLARSLLYKSGLGKRDSLRFVLEQPSSGDIIAERVIFRGWVASLDGSPIKVFLSVNNKILIPLDLRIPRLDVAQAFGLKPRKSRVGFETEFDWSSTFGDSSSAECLLKIFHGKSAYVVGPILLHRTESPIYSHERGNYKSVWNEVSRSHDEAMISVAGFADYQDFMKSGESTAETLKRVLRITPNDEVLEIGCGTGRIGASLAKECKMWVGADISPNMLKFAQENLKDLDNVRLIELKSCSLEAFADRSLDKVYSSAVFMHLDPWDRYRYVKESYRVLRPGGRVYFDNLNLDGIQGWAIFDDLVRLDPAGRPPHVSKHSTAEELHTYLVRAGFDDVVSVPSGLFVRVAGQKPVDRT